MRKFLIMTKTGPRKITKDEVYNLIAQGKLRKNLKIISTDGGQSWHTIEHVFDYSSIWGFITPRRIVIAILAIIALFLICIKIVVTIESNAESEAQRKRLKEFYMGGSIIDSRKQNTQTSMNKKTVRTTVTTKKGVAKPIKSHTTSKGLTIKELHAEKVKMLKELKKVMHPMEYPGAELYMNAIIENGIAHKNLLEMPEFSQLRREAIRKRDKGNLALIDALVHLSRLCYESQELQELAKKRKAKQK